MNISQLQRTISARMFQVHSVVFGLHTLGVHCLNIHNTPCVYAPDQKNHLTPSTQHSTIECLHACTRIVKRFRAARFLLTYSAVGLVGSTKTAGTTRTRPHIVLCRVASVQNVRGKRRTWVTGYVVVVVVWCCCRWNLEPRTSLLALKARERKQASTKHTISRRTCSSRAECGKHTTVLCGTLCIDIKQHRMACEYYSAGVLPCKLLNGRVVCSRWGMKWGGGLPLSKRACYTMGHALMSTYGHVWRYDLKIIEIKQLKIS